MFIAAQKRITRSRAVRSSAMFSGVGDFGFAIEALPDRLALPCGRPQRVQAGEHRHRRIALAPRAPQAEHKAADRRERLAIDRSNVDGSASGGTTSCSWDNSPRPGAGEKLSLLPAKVVEVGPCQTLGKLDVPRFSTLPGGQHTASVSRLPASGGDCGTSSMRGRLWLSTSVGRYCWCARRIGSSGTSPAVLSGTVRRLK